MHAYCIHLGLICLAAVVLGFDNVVKPSNTCRDNVCTFDWTIDYTYSMMVFNKAADTAFPVIRSNGYLWKRTANPNCSQYDLLSQTELSETITADGSYRLLYAINNQIPGPSIVAYEGATIIVNIRNNLLNEGITIHWHGLTQKNTPWMDGVPMVSQCLINPGQIFQYRFKATPAGTHWYHSHSGTLRTDGLAGSLIILPRPNQLQLPSNTPLPQIYEDFIGLVQTWHQNSSLELVQKIQWLLSPISHGYNVDRCHSPRMHPDRTNVLNFDAAVINGKGPKLRSLQEDIAEFPEIPFEIYEVKKGKYYRFRFANIAGINSFKISFDQHYVGVIAVDGNDVETHTADAVIISPGESVDLLVHASAPAGNYWIRFESTATNDANERPILPQRTLAILHYEESTLSLPTTSPRPCTRHLPCSVVNCIFGYYHFRRYTTCIPVSALNSTREQIRQRPVADPSRGDPLYEFFLNFNFGSPDDLSIPRASINGRRFIKPSSALQTYVNQNGAVTPCKPSECGDQCSCTQMLELPLDGIIQMVLFNNDSNPFRLFHPVHLHGHHFHVLKIKFPDYNQRTGEFLSGTGDIACKTRRCNEATWRNASWGNGNVPGLNLVNPPLKDTVIVPYGGYVVIRFRADNPGFWFLHCHAQTHHVYGMSLIMKEGTVKDMAPLPRGFPRCGNFKSSPAMFEIAFLRELLRQVRTKGVLTRGRNSYKPKRKVNHRPRNSKKNYVKKTKKCLNTQWMCQ